MNVNQGTIAVRLLIILFIATVVDAVQGLTHTTLCPAFSWDTVPVGFRFSKNDSLLTTEEAKFVASHASFIWLEKGYTSDQFKYTEIGIEQEALQLKRPR